MQNLTAANPELERLVRRTPRAGMMFWAGTSADPAATCGGCRHFGFAVVIRDDSGNAVATREYARHCALYKNYMGEPGASLDKQTPACKYFEATQT